LANDDDVDDEPFEDVDPADMVRAGVRFRATGRLFPSSTAMAGGGGGGLLTLLQLGWDK